MMEKAVAYEIFIHIDQKEDSLQMLEHRDTLEDRKIVSDLFMKIHEKSDNKPESSVQEHGTKKSVRGTLLQ